MSRSLKILVLSFYYEPDLCAGSFRATALVNELKKAVPEGSHIDVVTTLPNRYKTFSVDVPEEEHMPSRTIHRIALPPHQSGMLDQSKAFLAFSRQVLQYTAQREYDLVFATSSRLMTAVLGTVIARRKNAGLYLDIRDIFVDTIKDVLPGTFSRVAKPFFSLVERWAISQADHINLVSEGFADYFSARYPRNNLSFFTNGIDKEFIPTTSSEAVAPRGPAKPITVLYAGNIGEGQGLHNILPVLAKRMGPQLRFKIIGDGGRRSALQRALTMAQVGNVELLSPMPREELLKEYRNADVLFLHLNDYDAFKKVLPSKLFEYAALGKPIWAGVAGYAAEFIHAEIDNATVFRPCDANDAEMAFSRISLALSPRLAFIQKFARENIMKDMAKDILKVINARR